MDDHYVSDAEFEVNESGSDLTSAHESQSRHDDGGSVSTMQQYQNQQQQQNHMDVDYHQQPSEPSSTTAQIRRLIQQSPPVQQQVPNALNQMIANNVAQRQPKRSAAAAAAAAARAQQQQQRQPVAPQQQAYNMEDDADADEAGGGDTENRRRRRRPNPPPIDPDAQDNNQPDPADALARALRDTNPFGQRERGIVNQYAQGTQPLTEGEEREIVASIKKTWKTWRNVGFAIPEQLQDVVNLEAKPYLRTPDVQHRYAWREFDQQIRQQLMAEAARSGSSPELQAELQSGSPLLSQDRLNNYKSEILYDMRAKFDMFQLRRNTEFEPVMDAEDVKRMHVEAQYWITSYANSVSPLVGVRLHDTSAAMAEVDSYLGLTHDLLKDNEILQFKMVLWSILRSQGYRRGPVKDVLYAQVVVDGKRTHHWEPAKYFSEWLNETTSLANGIHALPLYTQLNSGPSSMRKALNNYFNECDKTDVPTVKPTPGFYSFKNGIYHLRGNKFYLYDTLAYYNAIPSDLCVYGYFPSIFNPKGYDRITGEYDKTYFRKIDFVNGKFVEGQLPVDHWKTIRVDHLDGFVNAQKHWDEDTKEWFIYAEGEMLYPNSMSRWDVFSLFVLGPPNVAKSSSLLKLCKAFPNHRIFDVSPDDKSIFTYQDCMDDMHNMTIDIERCLEVDKDYPISSNTLNLHAVGEPASSPVKNGSTRSVPAWEARMIWAGNHFFGYPALKLPPVIRRTVIFEALYKPNGAAPTELEVYTTFGDYMKKFALCHHERNWMYDELKRRGHPTGSITDVWKVLPKYLHKVKNRILGERNICLALLNDFTWLEKTDKVSDIVTLESLRFSARVFADNNGTTLKTIPNEGAMREAIQVAFPGTVDIIEQQDKSNPVICPLTGRTHYGTYIRGFRYGSTEIAQAVLNAMPTSAGGGGGGIATATVSNVGEAVSAMSIQPINAMPAIVQGIQSTTTTNYHHQNNRLQQQQNNGQPQQFQPQQPPLVFGSAIPSIAIEMTDDMTDF
jgi:hypothetical protein